MAFRKMRTFVLHKGDFSVMNPSVGANDSVDDTLLSTKSQSGSNLGSESSLT